MAQQRIFFLELDRFWATGATEKVANEKLTEVVKEHGALIQLSDKPIKVTQLQLGHDPNMLTIL